jgi:hypothetical protein
LIAFLTAQMRAEAQAAAGDEFAFLSRKIQKGLG